MSLLRKPETQENGRYQHITPDNAGWKYVGFDAYDIAEGASVSLAATDQERCLVLLAGKANIQAGDQLLEGVGDRMDVFEEKAPHAVYVPNGVAITITATTALDIAVCEAPGHGNHPVRWIKPEELSQEVRGEGSNTRYIRNILPDSDPSADSLLVVEVKTPSGNWSSYPPHKHDSDNIPNETHLEETYYHRLNPKQGFVLQRVFTDELDLDETVSAGDRSVVMVPRGYHPVGVPHGYESYYLNVMAGPTRKWIFKNHPDHEWIVK